MPKYKHAELEEDDASSNGSVAQGRTRVIYHRGQDLWSVRSLLEKSLIVLTMLLVLVVVILSSVVSVLNRTDSIRVIHIQQLNHSDEGADRRLCLTKECVTVSSNILNAMDHEVRPCDDFYEYSCGGWIKANPIPEGKSTWSTFNKLWQENQVIMKNVLENATSATGSDAENKARMYYHSCLDPNDTIEDLGAKPIQDLIQKVGGWNVSGEFDVTNWDFKSAIQELHNRYNMGGLFGWAVGEDDRNSSRHILQIDQGGLTLPTRDYYLNKSDDDEVLNAYWKYMTAVGVLLGGEENETRVQMKQVIEFEKKLANITAPSDERRDEEKLYHKMTIAQLQKISPVINWVDYFNVAFEQVGKEIKSEDYIVVYAPVYLANMSALVSQHLATKEGKIILGNYLIWHLVKSLTTCLSKPFRDAGKILQKALVGSDGGEEPWRFCVSDTNSVIGFALGAMFVREVFHGESKPAAENMINEIRTAFKTSLPKLNWMDEETRKLAKDKADAITDMIGFPDFILNAHQLDEKYRDLEFVEDEYFNNYIRVYKFTLQKNIEKIDKPVNKTRWGMSPPTVNAYYTPTKNQIVFPAGILQAPFYDIHYPRSLNFGGMGVVMGHELTHAFDDQGREYDKHGNLHQWWNNATIERFNKRAQCMVDQYSNYTVNSEKVNGRQTLGENIADNGGLKAAFHAYEEWVSTNHDEIPLPGLNLTHKQLFFVGFAQVWCSSTKKEATHLQIMNDPHTPPKYRVIGPLTNSHEFATTFNCPEKSFMNPMKKCEVW